MRIHEILTEDVEKINEGWKQNVAAAAMAVAGVLGGGGDASATSKPDPRAAMLAQNAAFCAGAMDAVSDLPTKRKDLKDNAYTNLAILGGFAGKIGSDSGVGEPLLKQKMKDGKKVMTDIIAKQDNSNITKILTMCNEMVKTIGEIYKDPAFNKSDSSKSSTTTGNKPVSKDQEYLETAKGWLDYNRSDLGPITKQVVQKLGPRGLQNMTQTYNNFLTDLATMRDPKLIEQYKSVLAEIKKDIDLYKSHLGQSDNKPGTKMSDAEAKKRAAAAARKAFDDANGFSKYNK